MEYNKELKTLHASDGMRVTNGNIIVRTARPVLNIDDWREITENEADILQKEIDKRNEQELDELMRSH